MTRPLCVPRSGGLRAVTSFCHTIVGMLRPPHRPALGLLALACAATSAHAEPRPNPQIALEYAADPQLSDCPSAAELSAAVSEQLGYDAFAVKSEAPRQRMRASISRTPKGTAAQVAWLDAHGDSEGERHLASESGECAEIARALTFAVAVQIQLHAALPAPLPPPAVAPPTPPRSVSRRGARPMRALVGGGVLAERGFTPETSPGLRLFGALWARSFSVEAGASVTLPSRLTFADGSGFSALSLLGSLSPCVHFSALGVCAVGAVGLLSVRGEGVDQPRRPSAALVAAGGRLQVLWPALSALGVLVHVEALLPVTSRTVVLEQEPVWSTAPVIVGMGCDLAAIIK
jgi:hypothetical protein